MARDRQTGPAPNNTEDTKAAAGGHVGIGGAGYAALAARLLDNGYEPLPILAGTKRPAPSRWTSVMIDEARVADWSTRYPGAGIGLRTGNLVAIDIDAEDPDLAHQIGAEVERLFGPSLVRVGRWPRRLLIYRTKQPFSKRKVGPVEVLGLGQQFVAFALHPDTGRPYDWVTGETPAEVPLGDLPLVDETRLNLLLAAVAAFAGAVQASGQREPRSAGNRPGTTGSGGWLRDDRGPVVDGRDAWLSTIAFHAVHDALDRSEPLHPVLLTDRSWARFEATTDLARGRQGGRRLWIPADAWKKVADKLRLLADGRLPSRSVPTAPPDPLGDLLPAGEARERLDAAIKAALEAATNWWSGDRSGTCPAAAIRATVGLGKSALSRKRIAAWQAEMRDRGLPCRVLVVTPSHALAEEAAVVWRECVVGPVAVLRGYEGMDPSTGNPMCQDTEMVRLALASGLSIGKSVCRSSKRWRCAHFEGCLKQQNKREVARAEVVLAPYDVLFTGAAAGEAPFGLLVIDEGFWQRAVEPTNLPPLRKMARAGLAGVRVDEPAAAACIADLLAQRHQLVAVLAAETGAQVHPGTLKAAGMTSETFADAARIELSLVRDAEIYPGMRSRARREAIATVKRNVIFTRMAELWQVLEMIIEERPGAPVVTLTVVDPDGEEDRSVKLHGRKRLMDRFTGIPVMHLDATLRREMLDLFFPEATVTTIEAAQPHQHLSLVTGSFGKTTLVPDPALAPEEAARRCNRLRDCVDHVRWRALSIAPRRVLVITYKAIEPAFAGIPGVETAHFNAIAGLDRYGDVGLLIVAGRPLPSTIDLAYPCASFFGRLPQGRYQGDIRAVHLRDGQHAVVKALVHADSQAELLRAAICDDELIQAIGRGRGVNRTDNTPLEVQLLADVALPLIHDRVVAWDTIRPDLIQRMLLAGIAVDSPADAAALHPGMFETVAAAEHAFRRTGFNRQNPIRDTYREMAVKSAAYRRPGRGRSWQRAWWIETVVPDPRDLLELRLGAVAEWHPDRGPS